MKLMTSGTRSVSLVTSQAHPRLEAPVRQAAGTPEVNRLWLSDGEPLGQGRGVLGASRQ